MHQRRDDHVAAAAWWAGFKAGLAVQFATDTVIGLAFMALAWWLRGGP